MRTLRAFSLLAVVALLIAGCNNRRRDKSALERHRLVVGANWLMGGAGG